MILILEDDQIASIFVAELKRQLLTLKEMIDTDDGSFDEDTKINNKTFKALLKVLKYNLVEYDYDKWVDNNLKDNTITYTLRNSISCQPDGTFSVNKKLLENLNMTRRTFEEDDTTMLNKPDKEICSSNEKPEIINQIYRDWNIEKLNKPYNGFAIGANYWSNNTIDPFVMLFSNTIEEIKIKIDMFYMSDKINCFDKVNDVENTFK